MLIYIITRPERKKLYEGTYQSLLSTGIDKKNIRKVYGYDATTFYDKRKLVACVFKDQICPFNEDDFLFVEDGAIFNENPLSCIKDRKFINWLGYIKVTKSYIIGAKCVYIPKDHIEGLEHAPLAHIDRMFFNYAKKNNCLNIHPYTIISLMKYNSCFGTTTQIERKQKLKDKLIC